eukprot:scaffold224144_cov35-Tisochrysis_lutea.AAC.1
MCSWTAASKRVAGQAASPLSAQHARRCVRIAGLPRRARRAGVLSADKISARAAISFIASACASTMYGSGGNGAPRPAVRVPTKGMIALTVDKTKAI